jgi:hypothetical protein
MKSKSYFVETSRQNTSRCFIKPGETMQEAKTHHRDRNKI